VASLSGPNEVTAGSPQDAAQLTIERRGHSRRSHHRHRLHALRDDVHFDLVAGGASPFSAAISGAISSTRETSCSKVGASVVNGSSSFDHHHTPASPSHSARISNLFLCYKLAIRLSSTLSRSLHAMVANAREQNHRWRRLRATGRVEGFGWPAIAPPLLDGAGQRSLYLPIVER